MTRATRNARSIRLCREQLFAGNAPAPTIDLAEIAFSSFMLAGLLSGSIRSERDACKNDGRVTLRLLDRVGNSMYRRKSQTVAERRNE